MDYYLFPFVPSNVSESSGGGRTKLQNGGMTRTKSQDEDSASFKACCIAMEQKSPVAAIVGKYIISPLEDVSYTHQR
jgi:hypothetical protein